MLRQFIVQLLYPFVLFHFFIFLIINSSSPQLLISSLIIFASIRFALKKIDDDVLSLMPS